MSSNIVLTYAINFGAVIALICAVYVFLIHRSNLKAKKAKGLQLDDQQ